MSEDPKQPSATKEKDFEDLGKTSQGNMKQQQEKPQIQYFAWAMFSVSQSTLDKIFIAPQIILAWISMK